MTVAFLLTILHHAGVFALVAVLAAEAVLVRDGMAAAEVERLPRLDLAYGVLAGIVLAAGLCRVFFGLKGANFYLGNPFFWTKLALFALIGLLSVPPTLRFAAWRRRVRADACALPQPAEVRVVRRFLLAQGLLLVFLPVLGAAMGLGFGV